MRYIAVILFSLLSLTSIAQDKEPKPEIPLTRILFVFDGSQSMFAAWQSGTKIEIARKLMNQMLDSLNAIPVKNFEIALRVYGHQSPVPPQDCNDTRLEVPFGRSNIPRIKAKLNAIRPKGTTPIARSLQKAAGDFPPGKSRNIIILITDGVEACDEDPCAVSRALQKRGVILKPFVIGVGLDESYKDAFKCVGKFFDASNEQTFQKVLGLVISQALNNTTAQVNLIDDNGHPSESNVNMSFIDRTSGLVKYNFIHTINRYGNPDTLIIDPLLTYDLVVHTLPQVRKDSINIVPGSHTVIGLDAGRGTLNLKSYGVANNKNPVKCIVRKHNAWNTLHVQDFNTSQEYLTGIYDLEILCLPRIIEKGVKIEQGTVTTIQLPPSGLANITSNVGGYGAIYHMEDNKMVWIYDLDPNKTQHSINLQQGNYKLVWRPKSSKSSLYTIERDFSIKAADAEYIKLF